MHFSIYSSDHPNIKFYHIFINGERIFRFSRIPFHYLVPFYCSHYSNKLIWHPCAYKMIWAIKWLVKSLFYSRIQMYCVCFQTNRKSALIIHSIDAYVEGKEYVLKNDAKLHLHNQSLSDNQSITTFINTIYYRLQN